MNDLLNLDPAAIGEIIFRTLVVYVALLLLLRLAGKRELGQMTGSDFVMILIISNAVQNAMVGGDSSLTGGLVAAATLLAANSLIDIVGLRSPWLRHRLIGNPALLVHEGELVSENLRREHVTEEEILEALRAHGVEDLSTVKSAVLEVDGTISVIPTGADSSRTRHRIRGRKPRG